MEISKKDLLKETGISYGQLYRWKREGLIPEAWFVKRSSFTGQETYFPREKILSRIHRIQELKDRYSLEELAKMLNPEISKTMFHEGDLALFPEIDEEIAASFMDAWECDTFTYIQLLCLCVFSECKRSDDMQEAVLSELIQTNAAYLHDLAQVNVLFSFVELAANTYLLVVQEQVELHLDERFTIIKQVSLSELSQSIKLAHKEQFQFIMEEE